MVPYILAAAATHAFSPVAGHAPNTRLQNTRVLRGGQAQASAGIPEAALAGLEPAEVQLATWLASDGGQSHLLSGWEDAALEDKRRLLAQVAAARVRFRVHALCPVARLCPVACASRPHAPCRWPRWTPSIRATPRGGAASPRTWRTPRSVGRGRGKRRAKELLAQPEPQP